MSQYLNLKPVELSSLSAKATASIRIKGRLLLPKYDGCFVIFLFLDGVCQKVLSRDGKTVRSMAHIATDLPKVYPWLDESRGEIAILGEAWSPSKTFKENSGAFRRHTTQTDLGFAPFDVVFWKGTTEAPELHSGIQYRDRLNALTNGRSDAAASTLVFRPVPLECEDYDQAIRYAQHLKAHGNYDGAVLSNPDATYAVSNGSKGEFLKIKPLLSHSLKVTGVTTSVGEKTGRPTGAVVVRWKEGRHFKVGTGFSEAEQADLFQFVGKVIEVSAMGEYPDGALREPRFMGVRDDAKAEF